MPELVCLVYVLIVPRGFFRIRSRKSIDLLSSTSCFLPDKSDETQGSLSLSSGARNVINNVAANATFNNCSINLF